MGTKFNEFYSTTHTLGQRLKAIGVISLVIIQLLHPCVDSQCRVLIIRIEITVRNKLKNFNGTSIHWHGIRQLNNNWMDGVAGITECPLPVSYFVKQ